MKTFNAITCIILSFFFLFCSAVKVNAVEAKTENQAIVQQATIDEIETDEPEDTDIQEIKTMLLYICTFLFFFAIVIIFMLIYKWLAIFF